MLSRYARDFEEKLREMCGVSVFLQEFAVFSLLCGCTGIAGIVRGLKIEEVDPEKVSLFLKKVAKEMGMEPKIVYATLIPGTREVKTFNVKDPCEDCERKYREGERKDLFIFSF
ncbi:MAG: DUF5402 family protein [Candidatus Syntropharchaeia archaeon]